MVHNASSSKILLWWVMIPRAIVLFVTLLKFAQTWMLQISPSDIYLTKNATLKAQCKTNKLAGIQSKDIKFRFIIDKQFAPESHKQNNSDHFKYEVPNKYIRVHNDSLVSITHDVYSPNFTNSVLECYVNGSIFTKSMVHLGDFPHNVTGVSCLVKNWKNMSCEITSSGKHEIFTTYWNYFLSDEIRSAEIKGMFQSGNSFVQENIFNHFKVNDTLIMEVFASNVLGDGYKSHFEFPLRNLVVPDPGYLHFTNFSNNYVILLSLDIPKPDEEFFILIEVNCSNMPSTYSLESNASRNNRRVLLNLSEGHLPASQNCSAFSRLKPLHYGIFSDKSNTVTFRTRDRVPLKNPEIFNSSFEVRHCSITMCDVDVYFKPLNVQEAQGYVVEYRVRLVRNGKVVRETFHANNGTPFVSIDNLSREHLKEYLVSIEAATEAGYNNTIYAHLMRLNAPFDIYKHLLLSDFLNKSNDSSKPLLLAMHLVVLNDSHVDIVYHLDDDSENIFIVWCLYDKSNQRCENNFSWKQLGETRGVVEFNVPSGYKIHDYHFGLQIGSGLQWIKFPCFFIASPNSKPGVPFFHDIIRNMSHILLNVSLPKCSETEAINFPGGYLVEWFDLRKNDNITSRTYHYLDNPIVIDGLHPGIFNISVYALPWKQGTCSEKFYFQHNSVDEGSLGTLTFICIAAGCVVVGIIALSLMRLKTKKVLKIDVPKNKQYDVQETVRGYRNFTSKVGISGYTICLNKDVEKIGSSDGSPYNTQDNYCFEGNDIGTDLTECHSNFVGSSSGHSYALTKLMDHSISLKDKLLNVPANPIYLGSLEASHEIMEDQMKEKCQHDDIMGSVEAESGSSCEHSLPDYPSTKLIINQPLTPADVLVKQEYILDKITSTNCLTETDEFGNVKDDYLITCVIDNGANSDDYCESVIKNVPMFLQHLTV